MKRLRGMRQVRAGILSGVITTALLIGGSAVDLRAQGPFSAQIQAALRVFLAQAHTWTGTQTYTGPVLFPDGSAGTPGAAFASAPGLGIYKLSATKIGVSTGIMSFGFNGTGVTQIDGASGFIQMGSATAVRWTSGTEVNTVDTGLSRFAAGVIGVGNGTAGDITGTLRATSFIAGGEILAGTNFLAPASGAFYWSGNSVIKSPTNGVVVISNQLSTSFTRLVLGTNDATTNGASLIFSGGQVYIGKGDGSTRAGYGRVTAQTAAVASIATYTVGAADGSFEISANVRVTTSTTHNFSVTCAYTDESNVAQTATLNFQQTSSTINGAIANAAGAVPYMGLPIHIRAKAATAITIASTGTFTTVTYNAEGSIRQIS